MAAIARIRYEIHFENELTQAPSGDKRISKVKAQSPADALHRLTGFSRGGGAATYHVAFVCEPTSNVVYAGHTGNGLSEAAGDKWNGEITVRPRLKRRQVTPRYNRLSVPGTILADAPASIECTVTLVARTTLHQHREPVTSHPLHVGNCIMPFQLCP